VISLLKQRKVQMVTFFKGHGLTFFVIGFWYTACMLTQSPLSATYCSWVP
jgi:hypothetical protein